MKKIKQKVLVLLLLGSILTLSSFIAIDISNYRMDSQKSLDIYNEYNLGTSNGQSLVYGTFQGDIVHLDPVYAYDSASMDVIDQVVEHLYWNDIADPNCPAVPALATAMPTITPDGLEWTIPLRQNVMFHDNTTMNATAVKWNFDRLMWFCNYSGNKYLPAPFNVPLPNSLPSGIPTPTQLWGALYQNPDGTPILNETVVVNANTIKFILNQPRAAWLSLLTFSGSGILSPTSTPANDYIQLHEDLIGTGPFMYDYFTAGVEIQLSANDDYWQGRPQLDSVTIVIFPTLSALNQALLLGNIDIITASDPAFIDQFAADPDIHLEYAGGTVATAWVSFKYPGAPGGGQQSLAMRKAISYCLNYTYIVDVVYDRVGIRWPTWIPMGIAYANYTLDYPTFDRAAARLELLNDPYYGAICASRGLTAASPDSAWTAVADGATPIESYNFSWNIGNDLRQFTGNRLAFDARYIGVDVEVNGMAWGDLVTYLTTDRQHLGMFMMGWRPDYIDPENYISAIWSPTASTNAGEYFEADVVALMDAGLTETDTVARKYIYDEIQRLMIERDFPGIPLTTGLNYDAWKNEVKGYLSNPLGKVWWYPVYIEDDLTPPDITINSLVYGTFQGDIVHLDPHYAYDSASIDVIDQVVERLYWFDIADPACPAVPALATAMPTITPDGLEWTIPLRQGVLFHDGTQFNASAVKWNFDRLMYFCNYSGNQYLPAPFNVSLPNSLPSGIPTPTQLFGSVYMNPDGTPILNETVVVNANTIKLILNQPRAAWLSLLTFSGSGILSPTSTPANDYIQLHEDLIGTGPFMYDYFTAGVEIQLSANDDYWQGRPQLDSVTIVIFPSLAALNQALLLGNIDIITAIDPAFIDLHDADPDIHLEYGGGTTTTSWVSFKYPGAPGTGQQSLAMRKAISYCLNYTHIIDVVYDGVAIRWPTWIPMGIAYANYTLDYPTFDRAAARLELLNDGYYGPICAGLGLTAASPDAAWLAVADGATPIEHYNYSWNIGNDLRHYTGDRLAFDMKYIGVACDVNGMAWGDLVTLLVTDREHLGMFMLGWRPDYEDPENYISAIWSPTASTNAGEYYEADVAALMDAGVTETDLQTRKYIYNEIQRLMVERDFPGITLTTGLNYDAWKNEVKGYLSNPLGNVWWYPVYIESDDLTPPDITILSPVSDQVFGVDAPTFSITIIDEPPLDSRWYTIDGGVTNFTFSGLIGTVNQTAWDDAGIGPISLTFYANDTWGNLGSETVNIFKEIVAPDITIHSPVSDQVFGVDAPTFSITIINESLLDSTWYTIDGGLTNYSFSELIGIINQTAWDDQESGPVAITFYARDDAGNEGSETVTVIKGQWLFVEIVEQSYTSDEFYIEFLIYNGINQVIDFAMIELWWDGVEVSSSVQNLGSGIYSVSLDPITVAPGEDPILLNMSVSADGYYNKYIEIYLAVDPEVIDKEVPEKKTPAISGYELLIVIGITCGALLIFIRKIRNS